jgi:hypothetical protein
MSTLEVSGCSLYFTDEGRGIPIVFIHETGANADIWGNLLSKLAARYRVIAYDRRGFSRSLSETLPDWQEHYSDATMLLQRLRAHPAVLVGWSSGGAIALEEVALGSGGPLSSGPSALLRAGSGCQRYDFSNQSAGSATGRYSRRCGSSHYE